VIVYGGVISETAAPVASREHDRVAFFEPAALAEAALADGYRRAINAWTERS
jgi:hypothetical protein